MWSKDFRDGLHSHCSLAMSISAELPYYEVIQQKGNDELLNALSGISHVQNSEEGSGSSFGTGEFDQFMVLQPNWWRSTDASTEFVFYDSYLISKEMIMI